MILKLIYSKVMIMINLSPRLMAYVFLTLTTLMWGGHAVVGKLAAGEITPFFLVSIRWFLAAPLATMIVWPQLKRDWPILKPYIPFALLLGLTGFTMFNSLFYMATYTTSAINIGITQGAIPVFVLIISRMLYRHKLTISKLTGIFITLGGVVVVTTSGSWDLLMTLGFAAGDLLMVVACLCYALYTNGLHKRPKINAMVFFAMMSWGGLLGSIPLTLYEIGNDSIIFVPKL